MAASLEEHLQTVLESALTGLELDQSGNTFAAQLAYSSALSCLVYCTDNLLGDQAPLVWLEACHQVQTVLANRIQVPATLPNIQQVRTQDLTAALVPDCTRPCNTAALIHRAVFSSP